GEDVLGVPVEDVLGVLLLVAGLALAHVGYGQVGYVQVVEAEDVYHAPPAVVGYGPGTLGHGPGLGGRVVAEPQPGGAPAADVGGLQLRLLGQRLAALLQG